MFWKIKDIHVEFPMDYIDYVSLGMVPSRKDVQEAIYRFQHDQDTVEDFMNLPDITEIMQRVADNRRKNRNLLLGITGGALLVLCAFLFGGDHKPEPDTFDEDAAWADAVNADPILKEFFEE